MSKKPDALGDRLKSYEAMETQEKFLPMLPVYARIDGRCFSKFTKGMKRPYDETMSRMMQDTTRYLVEHKGNRRLDVELSDENYKKYGIDKLEPTIENPFKVDYDDANLIEVINDSSSLGTIDSSDHIHFGSGTLHQEGL